MTRLRLGALLRERRDGRGVRDVAMEIGISPATLSRVEGGKLPDLETFRKMCAWLKINPAEILDIPIEATQEAYAGSDPAPISAAFHSRADVALSPEAANDLAQLILAAHRELARRVREKGSDVSPWL